MNRTAEKRGSADLLAALGYSWEPLSLRGGTQLASDIWGVFDEDLFQIAFRNPITLPCSVSWSLNKQAQEGFVLAPTERKVASANTIFGEVVSGEHSVTSSLPSFDVVALFDESEVAGITVVNLGKGRIGSLDPSQIKAAASFAADQVVHGYLNSFDPGGDWRDIASDLAHGKSRDELASISTGHAELVDQVQASLKEDKAAFLDEMRSDARSRVETILRFANSLA